MYGTTVKIWLAFYIRLSFHLWYVVNFYAWPVNIYRPIFVIIIGEDQHFVYEPSSVITKWHQYCVCLRVIPVTLAVRQQLVHTALETAICHNLPIPILQEKEKTWPILQRPTRKQVMFREYKDKLFFVDTAFWQECLWPSSPVMRESLCDELCGLRQIIFSWVIHYL